MWDSNLFVVSVSRGYSKRTLPHFREGELGAKAHGFVNSSYKAGLDPHEFFFQAMEGRDQQIEKHFVAKTSGYMQRRLVYALQDLSVRNDGTVRDNRGIVIQTHYGEDGIYPAKSDYGKVTDIDRLIEKMRIKSKSVSIPDTEYSPKNSDETPQSDLKPTSEESKAKPLFEYKQRKINNIYFDHYFLGYYQTKERHGSEQNIFQKTFII